MAEATEKLRQAITYIKAGDKASALQLVKAALKADKSNPNAWYLLATVVDERERQIKALENVLKIQPDHSRAQAMLRELRPAGRVTNGEPFIREEDTGVGYALDDSEKTVPFMDGGVNEDLFSDSVFLDDEDDEGEDEYDPRLQEADKLLSAGDNKRALPLIKAVLDEDKSDVAAWFMLAHVTSKTSVKIKALRKVVELNPDFDEARDWLAELDDDMDDSVFLSDAEEEDYLFVGTDNPGKSANSAPSMAFHVISFGMILLVGLGAYFGLHGFLGDERTVLADFDEQAGLVMSTGMTTGCREMPDTFMRDVRTFSRPGAVERDVSIQREIAPGTRLTGHKYEDYDTGYIINGSDGQGLEITVESLSEDYDPELRLYNPDGELAQDSTATGMEEALQIVLDADGEWILLVSSLTASECGQYILQVN